MVDVLNLEWSSSPTRDRQMATLVCNYLRFIGFSVFEGSIFEGVDLISRYNPKVLFIANATGAGINFKIVKYAIRKGIRVCTLVSEGNYQKDHLDQYLWGWNPDRYIYEDINLVWSRRAGQLVLDKYPEFQKKIKISGGVGFDLYKIIKQKEKNEFLSAYNKQKFSRVIGVGCWDFGAVTPEDPRRAYTRYSQAEISRFISDRNQFNLILKKVIMDNPDILFILKEHPGVILGKKASGIEGLEEFKNVLILKNTPIVDCISASDIWIVYESTTALEAWLLGKQTCLINPSGTDFSRENVYKGSPNYSTAANLQEAINAFFLIGTLPGFMEKKQDRDQVIEETIQWADGLNHVRAGNEIIDLLKKPVKEGKGWDLFIIWEYIKRKALLPFRKETKKLRDQFNYDSIIEFAAERKYEQEVFYNALGMMREELSMIKAIFVNENQ